MALTLVVSDDSQSTADRREDLRSELAHLGRRDVVSQVAQTSWGVVLNQALADAIETADVKPRQLADAVGVTSKTVERWIADPSRAPHRVIGEKVAAYLGVSSDMLWSRAVRSTVKTGPDREIMAAYPYRNACPSTVWSELIDRAQGDIVFAGYTNYFLWQEQPDLINRLRRKCDSGTRVRFLVGDPDSEVTRRREEIEAVPLTVSTRIRITLDALDKMRPCEGLEARFSDQHIALSVFGFDDEALVTPHLSSLLGHDSPMLHLRRLSDDGLFDRFSGHVKALWSGGRPVWGEESS